MRKNCDYKKGASSQLEYWPIISSLVLAFYFAILYFPPLTAVLPSNYVCLGCFVVWLILSVINDVSYYLNMKPFVLVAIVFYAFTIIIPFICGYRVIANRYASLILIPFGYMIYDYYKTHGCENYLKKVLLVSAAFATITALNTYKELVNNPYIARSIKSSGEHSTRLAARGIGGYIFVYSVAALAPLLLYIFLKSKKKTVKAISLTAYIFSIVLITKSNYLTAFLLVVITSAVVLCGYLLSRGERLMLYIPLIIVSVLLLTIFYDPIFSFIQNNIPERISKVLFNTSGHSMSKSISQEFIYDRLPSITNSLTAVFENPIFGILGAGRIGVSGNFLTGFGQHSYVLDTFALFGIIIGVIPLILLMQLFRRKGKWITTDFYLSIAMMTSVFFIYIMNNVTDAIAIVFTMVFPLVRDYFTENTKVERARKNLKKGSGLNLYDS